MNFHRRALVPVLATAAAAQTPPRRPPKHYTIEQFMATTSVRNASFSADEKRILGGVGGEPWLDGPLNRDTPLPSSASGT